jgi:hypothetical protein
MNKRKTNNELKNTKQKKKERKTKTKNKRKTNKEQQKTKQKKKEKQTKQ